MNLKEYLQKNPKLDRFSFGDFIKNRRLELGYSVREISKELNVTPAYVSDIEKGNRHAPKTLLNEICEVLLINEEDKRDFIDLAYLTHETCAPDIIQYLISNREARSAVRYLADNNIKGEEFLNIIENYDKNLEI